MIVPMDIDLSKVQSKQVKIRQYLYQRVWGVMEIDLKAYCTSIQHYKLIEQIISKIADGSMLKLLKQILKVGIVNEGNIITPAIGVS